MKLRSIHYIAFVISILLVTSLACSLGANQDNSTNNNQSAEAQFPQSGLTPGAGVAAVADGPVVQDIPLASRSLPADVLELEGRLIDLYNQVNPSVVHILVYTRSSDPLPLGSGSGFVFDNDGHIVTNNHVVEDGGQFEVIFYDGNRQRAEVIGRDVDSDLAILKVDPMPERYPPVTLGNSDNLQVGQLVIAIGNPFGEQGSMSLGIVSGLGRSLESQRQTETFQGRYTLPEVIQTDAPINPGNSGGPLITLNGEVIGINSAIRSVTGVNSGVGFSIPVNAVARIAPVLIEDGSYSYAYMGVQIQSLNLNLQDIYDVSQASGAYVTSVTEGGPADDAGLIAADEGDGKGGDLIIAIDGTPVRDTEELISYLVFNTNIGQTVDLTVIRDEETINVPLTLGERP